MDKEYRVEENVQYQYHSFEREILVHQEKE